MENSKDIINYLQSGR